MFSKIEDIINSTMQRPLFKEFTEVELINRAKLSSIDIENGNFISQEELEEHSNIW